LQEHGRTPDDALAELRRKWSTVEKTFRKPESPETTEQVNWVKTWPQRRRDVQQLLLRKRDPDSLTVTRDLPNAKRCCQNGLNRTGCRQVRVTRSDSRALPNGSQTKSCRA
jgi:hypothetical protein